MEEPRVSMTKDQGVSKLQQINDLSNSNLNDNIIIRDKLNDLLIKLRGNVVPKEEKVDSKTEMPDGALNFILQSQKQSNEVIYEISILLNQLESLI